MQIRLLPALKVTDDVKKKLLTKKRQTVYNFLSLSSLTQAVATPDRKIIQLITRAIITTEEAGTLLTDQPGNLCPYSTKTR